MADIEKADGRHVAGPQSANVSNGYSTGPSPHLRQIANPGPLGLFSFASTTLILSFVNVSARGVNTPNIVVGMALACGGLAQLLAGMWEFVCGNTFGATVFSSYGAFWISYGIIFLPGSGILAAYEATPELAKQTHNAVGMFDMVWFIFTFIMMLSALRSSAVTVALLFFLTLTFLMLMVSEFAISTACQKAGGALGIITAFIAYYSAASGVITPQASYFTLPVGDLPKRHMH